MTTTFQEQKLKLINVLFFVMKSY